MDKNPVLSILIGTIFLSFCWFAIPTFYELHTYYSLKEKAPADNIGWFVEKISSEDFRVGATYAFTVNGSKFNGETIFSDHRFRNPSSADDALKIKALEPHHSVFYNPQNQKSSSLENPFPFKNCLYSGFLFLLFLYFIGLRIYIKGSGS